MGELHSKAKPKGAAGKGGRSSATRSKGPSVVVKPTLLSGGNPQIAKADGDAPVQAYIGAMPGWKRDIGRRIDALIVRNVPNVRKAVKWNSPFYGIEGQGWFLGLHTFTNCVKVSFFKGTPLRPVPPGGTGKDARWIDVHENDLDEAQMAAWVKQAAALSGWVTSDIRQAETDSEDLVRAAPARKPAAAKAGPPRSPRTGIGWGVGTGPSTESPSALIDARIKDLGDWRGEMLARLRALIKQADPEVVEEWKWRGVPVWSHEGLICTGETYKSVVKATFAKGASLADPSGLFNSSLEGNTRRAIDFREGDKPDAEALKALIRAAVALNKASARG